MFADVTHELDGLEPSEPLGVVDHSRRARPAEIEEPLELLVDAGSVLGDDVGRSERTFARLSARVANQARPTANESNRTVPMLLETNKQHDDEQVSNVQAWRGWIESDVSCYRSAVERLGDLVGVLVE
jgi:hypothetical protein